MKINELSNPESILTLGTSNHMFGKAIRIKLRFTIDLSASEHLVRFEPGNFPVYCNAFIH